MKAMFVTILMIILTWACRLTPGTNDTLNTTESLSKTAFPYRLNEPDRSIVLPELLQEISGLSMGYSDKFLLAVQDESGILFVIDQETGSIKRKIPFGKLGDYEGVEIVGKDVFVLKNSGTLVCIRNVDEKEQTIETFNTPLKKDNDVEGLGYDAAHKRLLLACKGNAGITKILPNRKAIYGFDLNKKTLDTIPLITIGQLEVQKYLALHAKESRVEKLVEFFADRNKFEFSPSSIAVHPLDGNLYLLSAVGNIFMVINFKGEVVYMEHLKGKLHKQPEGLCFDSKGGLFLSNEAGDDLPGMIYYYKPLAN
jgi:uncharacterized protein YjiK